MKEYGVTIVYSEGIGLYSIEVDDMETNETVKIYDEEFDTFEQADKFVEDSVEAEFNIVSYHEKETE